MELTKEIAHSLFEYKDGVLYWKNTTTATTKGKAAGCWKHKDYVRVSVHKRICAVHRIVFLMHHGYLPKVIDHINGDKKDNRIENLREATISQNGMNSIKTKRNKSGVKGLCWDKSRNKWMVFIKANGISKTIGRFDDFELAELVAIEARNKYHGEFARF